MTDTEKPPRQRGAWMHGRSGVLIGGAFLLAFVLAGVFFAYRFYTMTGVNPAGMLAHPAAPLPTHY